MSQMTMRQDRPGRRALDVAVVAVAAVGQLVVGWFTSTTGLVAPLWAILALAVVWLGATALLVRLARRQPLATPLVPLVNVALIFAAVSAGEAWLGWTA